MVDQYVQVKIVNITDGGNNLYIDNINIGDLPTGIEQISQETGFKIYPNPTSDKLFLEFSENFENQAVKIYNTVGSMVLSKKITDKKTILSTETLPSGIYYIKLEGIDYHNVEKLIISR